MIFPPICCGIESVYKMWYQAIMIFSVYGETIEFIMN